MPNPSYRPPGAEPAYEAAIDEAITERARVDAEELPEARDRVVALEMKRERLSNLIESLMNVLPPERRTFYAQKLGEPSADLSGGRSGPVYSNVVELFRTSEQRDWTAPVVQEALTRKGVQADPKQIYNVLNYLEREGKLKRVSRGRYLFMGATIESPDPGDDYRHPWFRGCDD